MAVIRNNNGIHKRRLYKKKLHKRYNFYDLDNELKSWNAKTKSNKSRLDIWKDEEAKLTKQFNDEMAKERDAFYSDFENKKQMFQQNPNNVLGDQLKDMEGNFIRQEQENNRIFNSKIEAFHQELVSEDITLKNLEAERVEKEKSRIGTTPSVTTTTGINKSTGSTIDSSVVIDPVSNDNIDETILKDPSNNSTKSSDPLVLDNNEGNVTNSVDNKPTIDDSKESFNPTTLPLVGIIVVAIVAVACAAFLVIRKRSKTRQFKADFEMKPAYETSDIHVVTDNPRVITEDFINDYANDPQSPEPTDKTYQEYGKAYGSDEPQTAPPPVPAYSPTFNATNFSPENATPESPKSQLLSTTPRERELTIDDIIPLISPKAMKAPINKALDASQ